MSRLSLWLQMSFFAIIFKYLQIFVFLVKHDLLVTTDCLLPKCSTDNIYLVLYALKSQIKGKESENSYQELKRSQKDRHTQTHGNCIEIFRLAWPSFSIERE